MQSNFVVQNYDHFVKQYIMESVYPKEQYDIKLSSNYLLLMNVNKHEIQLTLFIALICAPHLIKLSTIELSPFCEAKCNGVN